MTQKNYDQSAVRRYLIKPLSANEREAIEDRLLVDEAFFEEVDIVENELIDEYLDDELSPDERENFEKYFLAHPARREKLEGSRILKRSLDAVPVSSPSPQPVSILARLSRWLQRMFFSSPRRLAPALPMVLVIIGGVLWLLFIRQSELQKGLQALNDAYRSERPIESRVSNLDHAEFISNRAPGESVNVDKLKRDRAYIFLSNEYEKRHDAASAHALGKFYLWQKDPNQAIRYLEEARAGDPNNPQIYTDLGAAYFEKGKQQADNSAPNADWAQSIIHLNKALELDPTSLAALFNRALVYQSQGMDHLAETDWRLYLQKDSNSPWAIEAQRKLKQLEEKKVTSTTSDNSFERFMQAYHARDDSTAWGIYKISHTSRGNSITKTLLNKLLSDKASQNEHADALNYLGQLELRQTQDAYTSHLSEVYRSASPEKLDLLRQAREQLDKGSQLFNRTKLGEAKEILVTARDTFIKLNDLPEALLAEATLAHVATLVPDLNTAQKLFERIIPQCEAHNYKWFTAQTLSNRAHMESNRSNYTQAISDANQALSMFQELDDPYGTLGSFIQLASFHYSVRDIEISFSYLRRARAITEAMNAPPPGDLWGIHITTALNLTALKLYGAALDHQNEALRIAIEVDKPLLLSRTYQNIGVTYGYLQQFELAVQNLRLAYDQGKRVEKEDLAKNMMANASLKLGDFYRASGDPGAALAAYDESLRLYELLEFFHYSYAAHKGKFLSYLSQQNDALAEHELQLVLKLFDEYRQKIRTERQKTHFFDREQDIYDLAIDFTYSRLGNRRLAFEYSEISRARNLRELMVNGAQVMRSDSGLDLRSAAKGNEQPSKQLTAAEIEQQVPEEVQIVQFAVLEKKVLIWHISKAGIVPAEVAVESGTLTKAVATTLDQIQKRDEPGATASLKNLYQLIIKPIEDKLDPNKVLCLVPDKALHYLPWGALISGSGRYLFQDLPWLTSPSATIFIESTNKARARASSQDERLLAVGNPSFDRATYPDLSDLPGAEREVDKIASNYPAAYRPLIGRRATRKSVLNELGQADVIHFAAHYEVDPRSTLSSKLLLAPTPGERSHAEPSALTAADIYGLSLSRTRLVVLSGCNTAIERDFAGEGPMGFARSFLVANVPVVVASLWPVDSDATSLLMIEFHRLRRKEKIPTAQALMRAQTLIMKRPGYENPYYWAGFMVVGGHANY